MAAVSRSTIPSLLASICSNVVGSIVTEGLEGAGEEALRTPPPPPRRRPSETRGTPPSLAWTVRSCRSRRSLRTKVLLHFKHLKGRSFVSVSLRKLAAVQFSYSRQTGVVGAGGSSYIASLVTFERQLPRFGGGGGREGDGVLTRSLVSAAVLTPTKGAVAKLALVLLLGGGRLLRRRVIRRI